MLSELGRRSTDLGLRHDDISREIKTMVDIPDTKVFAFKPLSARFKPWSFSWRPRSKVVPNSVVACSNVAAGLINQSAVEKDKAKRKQDLYEALALLDSALAVHPAYFDSYIVF
jgi:hypothetical protein